MPESDEIRLWSWVIHTNDSFQLSSNAVPIEDIKIAIKGRKASFKDITVDSIDLYKVGEYEGQVLHTNFTVP